jgi:DNA repair exonuclease SbcCD ATPase subunit
MSLVDKGMSLDVFSSNEIQEVFLLTLENNLNKNSDEYFLFKSSLIKDNTELRQSLVDKAVNIASNMSSLQEQLDKAKEDAKNISDPRVDRNDSIRILNQQIASLEKTIKENKLNLSKIQKIYSLFKLSLILFLILQIRN